MTSPTSAAAATVAWWAVFVAPAPLVRAEEPVAPSTSDALPLAQPPSSAAAPSNARIDWTAPRPIERPAEPRESGQPSDDDSFEPYFTAPEAPYLVGLRAVPSFGLQIQDGSVGPRFVMDVVLGLRAPLHRGYSFWALWPEIAYGAVTPGDRVGHELAAGLGFGRVIDEVAALRWAPWIVGEVADSDRLGLGLRNSVVGSLYDILSAELSHEWIAFQGASRHDVRLGVGLDLLVVITRAAAGEGLEP